MSAKQQEEKLFNEYSNFVPVHANEYHAYYPKFPEGAMFRTNYEVVRKGKKIDAKLLTGFTIKRKAAEIKCDLVNKYAFIFVGHFKKVNM